MELYTTPGGQWAGTEKDWKAAMKAEGIDLKTYEGRPKVDIPTNKAGLLEFLTFHHINVINPASAGVEAVGGGAQPPASPPAAPDLDALRALHNPEGVGAEPTTVPQIVTNLDEMFAAAPIPKQVELAVALLDRLEGIARGTGRSLD